MKGIINYKKGVMDKEMLEILSKYGKLRGTIDKSLFSDRQCVENYAGCHGAYEEYLTPIC